MSSVHKLGPCLWFDGQAEEAARFYTSVFRNSRITTISRFPDAGQEVHHQPAGKVMVVAFELEGVPFIALNGGPQFTFSEAVSFQVYCDTQEEIDYYWSKLSEGGDPRAQQCGWLKDRFGLSWQVVPGIIAELTTHPDPAVGKRVMEEMMKMKKIDLGALLAARGETV